MVVETGPYDPLPSWAAAAQVALVSGVPTQILIAAVLIFGAGVPARNGEEISFEFFAIVSLVDTALIAVLIRWFLVMSGERPREAILGARPIGHEALRGLVLLPPVFLLVGGVVLGLRAVAPWMQTVEHSPLEAFMQTPLQAGIFGIVVVIAGGIREELQRAFILHRFDQRLGGIRLGLVLFSMAFGLMHYDQGADVAVAVGLAGLVWGLFYVRRRSAVSAMVNHAAFNAAQVVQAVLVKTLGG